MTRTTIDFGIDLGTTNSSIAVFEAGDVTVFKNNENADCTPSAIWMDRKGRLIVGREAKEHYESDPENAAIEFKLQMGTTAEKRFVRSGRVMKPEELSTEVLKVLKNDVRQRSGEEVHAAVITVPAAFELPQCDATMRAARLAGFAESPLLQEPVAAALAYGFNAGRDKVFWLVYDFGGGTFDAAVIQVRDETIHVANHGGDNYLGGKLLDWAMVDRLFIPSLTGDFRVSDFHRGNPKWQTAFAKLKLQAEQAKIRLSRDESVAITIERLCEDDRGNEVNFDLEVHRRDVAQLAEPFIRRSVNICRRVLGEKGLEMAHVEKVLLVGGPTLAPYFRDLLADPREGLGIPLAFSVDPLTVVARGAAIFAGSQRLSAPLVGPVPRGRFTVELDYKRIGPDPEPLVGGKVLGASGQSLAGFTIEFIGATTGQPWRSGRLPLSATGTFVTTLWAEPRGTSLFRLELCDAQGTRQEVAPDHLNYTIGLTLGEQPLIHSLGVALAHNDMERLLEKGTPLPARHRAFLKTAVGVRRGQSGYLLRIPIMEGEDRQADRNQRIGTIEIHPAQITRDVPVGSEIQVSIEIDASRLVRASAFIPLLDLEVEKVFRFEDYRQTGQDAEALQRVVDEQTERLVQIQKKVAELGDPGAKEALKRIEEEKILEEVQVSFESAPTDRSAADECHNRVLALKKAIDEVEQHLEWPALEAEATQCLAATRELVQGIDSKVTPDERTQFVQLEREIQRALASRTDPDVLRQNIQGMQRLGITVICRQPRFWAAQLLHLESRKAQMRDPVLAERYLAAGLQAMNSDDFEGLKEAVRQLVSLLPASDEDRIKIDSFVTR